MTVHRSVPYSPGSRYTFAVKRFGFCNRPGWKVIRIAGTFWQLPPGIEEHFGIEQIERFLALADRRQLASWADTGKARDASKTRNATVPGVYWTGQHCFQVGPEPEKCVVEPFNEMIDGEIFTGIKVCFPTKPEQNYLLATLRDVTLSTFYKYLLFYNRLVYFHPVQEDWSYRHSMPYGRNRRLAGCSILNLPTTPPPCAPVPPSMTPLLTT